MVNFAGHPPLDIHAMGHSFQMIRVYATSVPAQMVELKAIGNRPYEETVCKPMGVDHSACYAQSGISLPALGCGPGPATRWVLADLAPEACDRSPKEVIHEGLIVPKRPHKCN